MDGNLSSGAGFCDLQMLSRYKFEDVVWCNVYGKPGEGGMPFILLVRESSADDAVFLAHRAQRRLMVQGAGIQKLNSENYLSLKCHLLPSSDHHAIRHSRMSFEEFSANFRDRTCGFKLSSDYSNEVAGPALGRKIVPWWDMIECPMELMLFGPPVVVNWRYPSVFKDKTSSCYLHHIF